MNLLNYLIWILNYIINFYHYNLFKLLVITRKLFFKKNLLISTQYLFKYICIFIFWKNRREQVSVICRILRDIFSNNIWEAFLNGPSYKKWIQKIISNLRIHLHIWKIITWKLSESLLWFSSTSVFTKLSFSFTTV